MKIVSLNTFGGKFFKPLMKFMKSIAKTTDFFCFQEVLDSKTLKESGGYRANFYDEFINAMQDFQGYFALAQEKVIFDWEVEGVNEGIAIFAKKSLKNNKTGDFFINNKKNSYNYRDASTFPNNLQYAQIEINGKLLTVCNVYGTSHPGDKLDTPARLDQTKKILDFVNKEPGEKIIMGDFNLFPNTKSVKLFEERGFQNLIKDFYISTTRGSLVKKLHPEYGIPPSVFQEHADFTFASPGLKITKFEVPDLPISDHLPMIVEFEIKK